MSIIKLDGPGAAYLRVSDDQQDTLRQYESLHAFEKRHSVTIPKQHWFEDEGWARDTADYRPNFQRLMKLAESAQVRWIVVDQLDRFGTKNSKQLISYLYRLEEAGCKLYDATGKEWTGEDVGTTIVAVVEGEKSKGEQTKLSHRVLGGKVAQVREGEWQGGFPRLGFDVACYSRATGAELWRVVGEGLHKRLKVYPDGRQERCDGKGNVHKCQRITEVLRVTPSKDQSKIDAAVSVFKRFATESVSENELAHYLNGLGFLTAQGNPFIGHHIKAMLQDPVYIGYYAWNRRHFGKFHRWKDGQTVLELNYDEQQSDNDKADWVQSRRLFEPLVDRATWDAAQTKLNRPKRENAPRSAALYLSGLAVCGNCGSKMIAGRGRSSETDSQPLRFEFICGGYHRVIRYKSSPLKRGNCTCLRNSVFQHELEEYVERYLEETGKRLEKLTTGPTADCLTDKLQGDLVTANNAFWTNWLHMLRCIAEEDPASFTAVWEGVPEGQSVPLDKVIAHYRSCFDPASVTAEIEKLEDKHTDLYRRYADLPTPRAKEKAKAELVALEGRIAELEDRRKDIGATTTAQLAEVLDLASAIKEARRAMESEEGARALRQKAQALRGIIHRIECTFQATGATGGGHYRKNTKLAKVTIYPVVGEARHFLPANVLRPMRATSHM